MNPKTRRRAATAIPLIAAAGLFTAACGSTPVQTVAAPVPAAPPPAAANTPDTTTTKLVQAVTAYLDMEAKKKAEDPKQDKAARDSLQTAIAAAKGTDVKSTDVKSTDVQGTAAKAADTKAEKGSTGAQAQAAGQGDAQAAAAPAHQDSKVAAPAHQDSAAGTSTQQAAPVATQNHGSSTAALGASDVGVSREAIRLGTINMHGMPLGNLIVAPQVRGVLATATAINDRGGVLGRRINITDCDDGPGEVSRSKACVKKLVDQDRVFSLISGNDWGSASIHDDLMINHLPLVGDWAYSQTEWQDPFMFPAHMSMIHEAMAGGSWVRNVIKPKTYGLICLTSPEMQLACNQVQRILNASGSKLVKRLDVPITETSMSSEVLAMRSANPEHIVHYVINPATMIKFMVESASQEYYPPKGISGNHLAGEAVGGVFGKWPAGRYWTNTTYKLWGAQFMATMNRYARGNRGLNHHVIQAGYVGVNMFAEAARSVGPNLTRDALMAALGNGVWRSDADLDQKFSYTKAERGGDGSNQTWDRELAQGREFMYKMTSDDTVSNPDGTPAGWQPDPDQFVIYTR